MFTFDLRMETQSRLFGSLLGSPIHLDKRFPADVASVDVASVDVASVDF